VQGEQGVQVRAEQAAAHIILPYIASSSKHFERLRENPVFSERPAVRVKNGHVVSQAVGYDPIARLCDDRVARGQERSVLDLVSWQETHVWRTERRMVFGQGREHEQVVPPGPKRIEVQ
jgi:hypothetical protein